MPPAKRRSACAGLSADAAACQRQRHRQQRERQRLEDPPGIERVGIALEAPPEQSAGVGESAHEGNGAEEHEQPGQRRARPRADGSGAAVSPVSAAAVTGRSGPGLCLRGPRRRNRDRHGHGRSRPARIAAGERAEQQQVELVEHQPAGPRQQVRQRQRRRHDEQPQPRPARRRRAPAGEGQRRGDRRQRMAPGERGAARRGGHGDRRPRRRDRSRRQRSGADQTSTSVQAGWPRKACGLALAP